MSTSNITTSSGKLAGVAAQEPSKTGSGQEQRDTAGEPLLVPLIGLGVMFALALATWTYANVIVEPNPMLWYLNWPPGTFSTFQFASGVQANTYGLTFILMGGAAAIVRQTPMPALSGLLLGCAFLASSSGIGGRLLAYHTGVASIECMQPGTSACLLNDFNRMFDLGWTRPMTDNEKVKYAAYVALRERAKLGKPLDNFKPSQLNNHQLELHKWEARFKPELDAILNP